MSEFKEFTGKNLDDAIAAACSFFDLERDKLEVEIISGGSSGIFGLMGKKKAVVKAKSREPMKTNAPKPARKPRPSRPARPASQEKPVRNERKVEREVVQEDVAQEEVEEKNFNRVEPEPVRTQRDFPAYDEPTPGNEAEPEYDEANDVDGNTIYDDIPAEDMQPAFLNEVEEGPLEDEELETLIRETVNVLCEPICGEVEMEVIQTKDRIKVVIEDNDKTGLLIGREGQTLNSIQYLTNRIVSKQCGEQIKIQIDTGQYRERQDDKLRQMAFFLADKAKNSGRVQSTRPLSSYHRRVVHMALQGEVSVSTRSKGDGPLKRVLILPKQGGNRRRYNR